MTAPMIIQCRVSSVNLAVRNGRDSFDRRNDCIDCLLLTFRVVARFGAAFFVRGVDFLVGMPSVYYLCFEKAACMMNIMSAKTKKPPRQSESDGAYLLKIVMYIIFGSLWIKLGSPVYIGSLPINGVPFGLFIGLLFASHDHFQVDRKIEYVLLILVAIISYFLPSGIVI